MYLHGAAVLLVAYAAFCAAYASRPADTCSPDADGRQPEFTASSLLQIRKGAIKAASLRHTCGAVGAAYEHVGDLLDRHEEISGKLQSSGRTLDSAARDAHGFVSGALTNLREHSEALLEVVAEGDCAKVGASLLELDRHSTRLQVGLDHLEGLAASRMRGGGCCFRIGFGDLMKPCCLKTEAKGKEDCLEEKKGKKGDVGGATGWSEDCPADADKANELIKAQQKESGEDGGEGGSFGAELS